MAGCPASYLVRPGSLDGWQVARVVLGQNPLKPPLDLVEPLAAAVTGEQDFSRALITALL
jgi:hypothetical protein